MKQQAIQYLALDVHKATDLPLTGADPHAKVSRPCETRGAGWHSGAAACYQ